MIQQLTNFEASIPSFPIHPANPHNSNLTVQIKQFVEKYHHAPWIVLEDNIQFDNSQEFMKRYYKHSQFDNKIKLLGDYYRFHFQAPRMFQPGFQRIFENHTQDKRALQYQIVTNQVNRTKICSSTLRMSSNRLEPHQKIIKDVELSYKDFQCKPEKEVQQRNIKKQVKNTNKNTFKLYDERPLSRANSISHKGSFVVFKPKETKNIQPEKQIATKKKDGSNAYKKPLISSKTVRGQQNKNDTKKNSTKFTSVNNSVASHKGLSRSKSKLNLQMGSNKMKSKQTSMNTSQQKYEKNAISNKSSLKKCDSKTNMLSEKKNFSTNPLSRKGSRTQLLKSGQDGKVSHKVISITGSKKIGNENTKEVVRKQDKKNGKTMFTKAIQIRRRA